MNAKATTPVSDNTRDRIRAFIYSMRPLDGVADMAESDEYQRGRALLERLADSAEGENDPSLGLNPEQCAQVCEYLSSIEPFNPVDWWNDTPDQTSHVCGFHAVVDALAASHRQRPAAERYPGRGDTVMSESPPKPPKASAFDLVGTAQDELQAAASLCRAGALALRAAAKPDIPAGLPETQQSVVRLVDTALKGLRRALDALEDDVEAEEVVDVTVPIFNVFGLLCVIQSALNANEPVAGGSLVDNPIADSLDVVAAMLGEDIDEGLSARCEAMLTELREASQH